MVCSHFSKGPGLAFLEGLALIVSPCILPVLPLVLSASDRWLRQNGALYGIITGFIIAFSLFVLGSRALVNALNVDLDYIRYVSLALLFVFGLVLLSEKLSGIFSEWTQGAADFGSRFGSNAQGGFVSGVIIGALIGLVWTPCAGPILAAVLVQVISQKTGCRKRCDNSVLCPWRERADADYHFGGERDHGTFEILHHACRSYPQDIRRRHYSGGGCIDAIQFQCGIASLPPIRIRRRHRAVRSNLRDALAKPYAAPEFTGITDWLNSKPLTMKRTQRQGVVLVDFWTYSCINCVRTFALRHGTMGYRNTRR